MSHTVFRSVLRIAAVAGSALLAGIYVYDRAGGDLFGLRAAESPPDIGQATPSELAPADTARESNAAPTAQGQSIGHIGPMPDWYSGSAVVTEPYPFINQGANSPRAHIPSVPIDTPQFSDPPRRTVLPGSKSDAGIDISIGLQSSP